jgi:uncharacterized protein (TIGR02145 family)
LITAAGGSSAGKKLKAKSGWGGTNGSYNGTDDFEFSALPGGSRLSDGTFGSNDEGYWWTSTEYSGGASIRGVNSNNSNVIVNYYSSKPAGHSVRCVKDN